MQANDVRVLKSAAVPTFAVGVVAVIVAFALAGGRGALGAALGTLLVGVFFSISVVAVSYAARVSPQMMAIAAMVSYLVKVVAIMVVLSAFRETTAWNTQPVRAQVGDRRLSGVQAGEPTRRPGRPC